jgi:hypothetical protein
MERWREGETRGDGERARQGEMGRGRDKGRWGEGETRGDGERAR